MLCDELVQVLERLGSSFDDVIVGWARVPFLNESVLHLYQGWS